MPMGCQDGVEINAQTHQKALPKEVTNKSQERHQKTYWSEI